MSDRLAQVRRRLDELEIDALLVTQTENRRYLSGFTGSAGVLLISRDRSILATDSRYWEQAERQAPALELVRIKTRLEDHIGEILGQAGHPERVGFESAVVSVDQHSTWSKTNGGVEWVATKNAVEPIRAVKDESELAAIRRAAAVTDAGFDFLCGILRPGLAELEAAWELEVFLRTHGADSLAFDVIVASGPHGAMAHHEPGARALQAGEPIVIDFGAKVDGYCADMTRTVSLGRADERFDEVYETVRRAQQAALDGMRAGMPGMQADALAREVIVAAGYGDFFGHGLGHGVGLSVHEAPRAGRVDSEAPLPVGATLTVEPGVYLQGWGGVRIEDLVVVREDGVEVLSRSHKQSII